MVRAQQAEDADNRLAEESRHALRRSACLDDGAGLGVPVAPVGARYYALHHERTGAQCVRGEVGVMDPPPIRYARSADGANIAYWTVGSGPSLLVAGLAPLFDTKLSWESDAFRQWIERLSTQRTVSSFDWRGTGQSERGVDFSIEQAVSQLRSVVEEVAPEGCAILGLLLVSQVLIAFAAEHPSLVTHLITLDGYASHEEYAVDNPEASTIAALAGDANSDRRNEIYAAISAGVAVGTSAPAGEADHMRKVVLANLRRLSEEGMSWSEARAQAEYEVSDLLSRVRAPALVLQRAIPGFDQNLGRTLAAGLPDADFRVINGDALLPYIGGDEVADLILGFTDEPTAGSTVTVSGFQTILFTDLEASTPLTQRLGDEGAQELLRGHNAAVRGALDEHGGREVKHTGDGIMASFPSAVAAVTAALQIQRDLAGGEVRVRVGLNAGEPIAEDDDLFGLSVIKAARIADRAEPGQVLVSNVVMELCEGKTFEFASLGPVRLKGFDEAVTLFEVTA